MAASRRKSGKSTEPSKNAIPSPARRRVAVLVSLVVVLSLTSALLLALAPAPLRPQATQSLFALDAPQSFDSLFDSTTVPMEPERWHNIYIHHSATVSGSAQTLAESTAGLGDHFVIGNGDGCGDGEVQIGQRWTQQLPPGLTPGAKYIDSDCISICLIGDFNLTQPTPTQQRRLVQLIGALQNKLRIVHEHVYLYGGVQSAAGVGRFFPARDFQAQIAP